MAGTAIKNAATSEIVNEYQNKSRPPIFDKI